MHAGWLASSGTKTITSRHSGLCSSWPWLACSLYRITRAVVTRGTAIRTDSLAPDLVGLLWDDIRSVRIDALLGFVCSYCSLPVSRVSLSDTICAPNSCSARAVCIADQTAAGYCRSGA
ncbi:unnamed protein product [Strongylus vulgaris]|uniref:Uncharacterized protein n=1 Tax=Strongylus vulgaris TaxID=40348 RepID=A0A3P7J246_STRVU|nr:unnamed protein product [Strongylus vulgaris]